MEPTRRVPRAIMSPPARGSFEALARPEDRETEGVDRWGRQRGGKPRSFGSVERLLRKRQRLGNVGRRARRLRSRASIGLPGRPLRQPLGPRLSYPCSPTRMDRRVGLAAPCVWVSRDGSAHDAGWEIVTRGDGGWERVDHACVSNTGVPKPQTTSGSVRTGAQMVGGSLDY